MDYFDTEKLNVGDEVGVQPSSMGHSNLRLYKLCKVSKLTKTQIVLDDNSRFNRRNGHEWGTGRSWYYRNLAEAGLAKSHNEIVAEKRKHIALLDKVSKKIDQNLSMGTLEKIKKILDEA